MPYSPALQIWGVAKESTVGTAVAPTFYPKLEKFDPKIMLGDAFDRSIRNDMADVHGAQQTSAYVEIDFSGQMTPDDMGHFFLNLFGADTVTGGSAPYSHSFSLLNTGDGQPPTHTWTHFNGLETRAYAGCRVESMTFKYVMPNLIAVNGKMFAQSYAIVSKPTPTYTAIVPTAAWNTTVTLNSIVSSNVLDLEFTISRTIKPIFTLSNTQVPYKIFASGDFKFVGKAVIVYDSIALFGTNYLGGGLIPIVCSTTTGATSTTVQLQHTLTTAYLQNADIKEGAEHMELSVEFTGIANSTDAGASGGNAPGKTIVQNAVATY